MRPNLANASARTQMANIEKRCFHQKACPVSVSDYKGGRLGRLVMGIEIDGLTDELRQVLLGDLLLRAVIADATLRPATGLNTQLPVLRHVRLLPGAPPIMC